MSASKRRGDPALVGESVGDERPERAEGRLGGRVFLGRRWIGS